MIKKIIITFFFFALFSPVFSQGEFNNWYFGENAGISFASGSPVALTDGALNTYEGCASISDKNGNLLFYTEGTKVWNKNHMQMSNGFGLMGHWSSAQSSIIVPWPGDPDKYYIFTTTEAGFSAGLRYSVVDMTLNGGLGNVTTKNILLYTPACERLAAVRDRNGCNVWVVSHKWQSTNFYAYKITGSGINITPVISAVGRFHGTSGPVTSAIGQLKISPAGNKIAMGMMLANHTAGASMEVFDFDNSTGRVSNPIILTTNSVYGNWSQTYSCEFSPNGKLLYGTSIGKVYQFDISSGIQSVINASRVQLSNVNNNGGALQLGPDKKMYHVTNKEFLSVINNPDVPGTGCNYVSDAISLAGRKGTSGFPSFLILPDQHVNDNLIAKDTCMGNHTLFSVYDTSDIISTHWHFGDPASTNNTSTGISPTHLFPSTGTYTITLIRELSCKSDTLRRSITILPEINVEIFATGSADCSGLSNVILSAGVTNATIPYTYSWSNGSTENSLSNASVGEHAVTVTDVNGCKGNAQQTVASDETYSLFTPNTFTPNNDGINDIFLPKGVCIQEYQLYIFNRWGNLVFTSNDSSVGWDGKLNNSLQATSNDTYAWRIIIKDYFGKEHHDKGHVNLLK